MSTTKIVKSTRVLCFFVLVFIVTSCGNDLGLPKGNVSLDNNSWSVVPIIIFLGIGFLLGLIVRRRRV